MAHFTLNLLRIAAGLLFMQHGAQKLFGVLGRETPVEAFSLLWVAGVLELYGGALVVIGLFTRPVSLTLAGLMAAAYVLRHAERALFPIANGGELAALFFVVFLYLAGRGGGAVSIDGWLAARRRRAPAE